MGFETVLRKILMFSGFHFNIQKQPSEMFYKKEMFFEFTFTQPLTKKYRNPENCLLISTAVYVTLEGQNEEASFSKELNKEREQSCIMC